MLKRGLCRQCHSKSCLFFSI